MTDNRKRRKPGLRITINKGADVHIDCPDGSRLIIRNEGHHHAQIRFLGPETFRIRRAEIAKVTDAKAQEIQAAFAESPAIQPMVCPSSEGVGRMADNLRQGWAIQPPVRPSRNAESRLVDLVLAVKEIIAMNGEPDWRGLLTEALEDAAS